MPLSQSHLPHFQLGSIWPIVVASLVVLAAGPAWGQSGGRGGPPGTGAGPDPAPIDERPKFRDHVHTLEGISIRREKGDAVVAEVRIVGNQRLDQYEIAKDLQTRQGRFFDNDTVLGDIRRLNDLGAFERVTFKIDEVAPGQMVVTFIVRERDVISKVFFHGERAYNETELSGRAGIAEGDPLNEFSIESARRRLVDYLHEEGFNQATIESSIGFDNDPNAVIFRINEGPLERINKIRIHGATIVSEARLKKVITSRKGLFFYPWAFNVANFDQINRDVDVLASYYHNLGFLTATVGRTIEYDKSGKWLTIHFYVDEGPRFKINEVRIVGNKYVTAESMLRRLQLKGGEMYDGSLLRADVSELIYGYGELGFLYAEIQPQTILRDGDNVVDIVYDITEGDRWRVGQILVNIEGAPDLIEETTLLNFLDLREGDWINRRTLELNQNRLARGNLLETNPQVAEAPDIRVVPRDEEQSRLR